MRVAACYQKSAPRLRATHGMSAKRPALIHFRGGRSDRWRDLSGEASLHARHGPRWNSGAAAATRALQQLSKQLGYREFILPILVKGLQDDDMWEAITRATRKACSLFQYENAISILEFHRDKADAKKTD